MTVIVGVVIVNIGVAIVTVVTLDVVVAAIDVVVVVVGVLLVFRVWLPMGVVFVITKDVKKKVTKG